MKANYLTLNNGMTVRILWNMNALGEFTKVSGKEMTDLAEGKADVNNLRTIAWCSAKEGEAADGKELKMDEIQFGREMTMASIVEFSEILASQSGNNGQKKSPKGRIPQLFFRNRG